MKKIYTQPELEVTKLLSKDILSASDDEIFIGGDGLFDED